MSGWRFQGVGAGSAAIGTLWLVAVAVTSARAETTDSPRQPPTGPTAVGPHEVWAGADAGTHNWLVYSGGTYAPDSDIHADGIRLRATGGYGGYSYDFDRTTKVRVTKTIADVLIGYQLRAGEMTAKAFVGWALLDQQFSVPSLSRRIERLDNGIKGALEVWLNVGTAAWTSLDISYADTRETASVRSRFGYRVLPTLSAGPEAVFNHADLTGDVQTLASARLVGNTRVGGFVRYEWFGGEISASGGVSGDWIDRRGPGGGNDILHAPDVYGTVNWITQY